LLSPRPSGGYTEAIRFIGGARNGSTWSGGMSTADQATMVEISRQGYTGHTMLGFGGLIHMNGRVQDSVTGRFLSPDPYVTEPGHTQGYNRYAYVRNNPASFVDPSGFAEDELDQVTVTAPFWSTYGGGTAGGGGYGSPTYTAAEWEQALRDRYGDPDPALQDPMAEVLVLGRAHKAPKFDIGLAASAPGLGLPLEDLAIYLEGYIKGLEFCLSWCTGGEIGIVKASLFSIFKLRTAAKSAAQALRPRGVPAGWVEQAGRKAGNTKYVNPANPHDYVRVKPDGTITQVRNGKAFDANGNPVNLNSPDAHGITPETFVFRE
jgi:RHS repeat-associated protein